MSLVDIGSANWQPLAGSDPVPGDPVAVQAMAARSAAAAEQAGRQAASVRRVLSASGWEGLAAEAFRTRLSDLPVDLDAVADRFQWTALALRELAPALEAAQGRARTGLAAAHDAQLRAGVLPGTPPNPLDDDWLGAAPPAQRELVEEVARARRILAMACEERDRAAARCARVLRAAADDRLRNPHGWHRVLQVVSRIAGHLSAWLGVAAVLLIPCPGLGQIVGALALTVGLVALACDLALSRSGDTGWPDLLGDVVGVVPAGRMMRAAIVVPAGVGTVGAVARAGRPQVARDLVHGFRDVARARAVAGGTRAAGSARAWRAFLHSPGGLLHDVAVVEAARGRRGLDLLMRSYGVDLEHSAIGVCQDVTPAHPRKRR